MSRDNSLEGDRDVELTNDSSAPLLSDDAPEGRRQVSSAYREDQPELGVPKLLALTCINGGLQVFFSTVMANLPPYLHTLGLSKSATAAIIICLPLSGTFIGPMAGAFSDRLRTRFGRRRPIILGGAILTTSFLLLLSWTEQVVKLLAGCLNTQQECGDVAQRATVALAVICTIFLSIFVQPVQAGVRSLMVDIAPASQQSLASSWAGRIQGASSIFSFFASSLNLPGLPGLHRLTQFQALSCLNLITLGSTVLITCVFIREKDSQQVELADGNGRQNALAVLKHIFRTVRELRGRIRQTCLTQFCSWFAWFPLLYYTTTYIGEIGMADLSIHRDDSQDHGAQEGSLASLNFAIVGFVAIMALPVLLPYAGKLFKNSSGLDANSDSGLRGLIWIWVVTQPLLGVLLFATLAAVYRWQGIVLIAAAGLPWAITQWVPPAIVGYETSRLGLTGTHGDDKSADSSSGAILGVHNLAISLPQVLSGLLSSLTYKIAEGAGSQVPTSWVLASSGIAAFLASVLAKRML